MDPLERLSLADVRAGTPLALEHLHRYELVAGLCRDLEVADVCCGAGYGTALLRQAGAAPVLGVDNDPPTIERARDEYSALTGVEFERADAAEFLERAGGRYAAVVMFEGLEHLPDPERALAALRELAAADTRLAVSIPNSRALGEEDNPFHHTDFGYGEAIAALRGLAPEVAICHQFAAEGSLIRGPRAEQSGGDGEPESLPGHSILGSRAEPELASHLIGFVNFDPAAIDAAGARLTFAAASIHRRYMLELEQANRLLWDRLGRIEASIPYRATRPLRALRNSLRRR